MAENGKPDNDAPRGVAALAPRSNADLAVELHKRLAELLGETCELMNDPRWRHLLPSFQLGRDATGRWFVVQVGVNLPG